MDKHTVNVYKSFSNLKHFQAWSSPQQSFSYHKENDTHGFILLRLLQNVVSTPDTDMQSGRLETNIHHI